MDSQSRTWNLQWCSLASKCDISGTTVQELSRRKTHHHAGRTYPAQWWSRCRQLSSAAASARPARPKVPGFFCMEGYRGNSHGFSHLWKETVTLVTMALAEPLVFGLSLRLCFLVFLSFQCLKTIQKIEKPRENDTISWNDLDGRLTKYESDCRALQGLNSIWKWKKIRAPSTVRQVALWERQLQSENLLQTARKGVGEAGSDFH